MDVAPTVLYLSGINPTNDMEGQVLKQGIKESYLKDNPITYSSSNVTGGSINGSRRDSVALKEKLRELGYLND